MPRLRCPLPALLIALAVCALAPLRAAERIAFDIPAGPAERSLRLFIVQSGAEVIYAAEIVRAVQT